jgi:hypothetical protein
MTPSFKSPKLEDIKELQKLVADNIDSVEAGLRLLDQGVLLGGTTIELLAVDAAGALTLMALALQADDTTMLRGLEAYSWCMESPDAMRRLYPAARLSTEPPRMIFVAERVPEAFLRKIRHLRFQRVDCLEFRVGLQFNVAGEARGTSEARGTGQAAFPPPAPARRGRREPPPARAKESPRGEPFGEAVGERLDVDEVKVQAVRAYLQQEFPTAVIYDFFSHDHGVQTFHLQDSYGALVHSATVSVDVLAELRETDLSSFLEKHKLARVLRQAGTAEVAVSKSGLKIEQR